MIRARITLCLVLLGLCAVRVEAATITVGSAGADFATIQEAIDDDGTEDGDTILILDGVHTESGILISKDLVIEGLGANQTVVQAHESVESATDRVFDIPSGSTVTLADLTIRHGNPASGDGGGVRSNGADLTILRCHITANRAVDQHGGGLAAIGGSFALADTTFSGNEQTGSGYGGGGAYLSNAVPCDLVNSTFSGNTSAGFGGGCYWRYGIKVTRTFSITHCTFADNSAQSGGDDVCFDDTAGLDIHDYTFVLANSILGSTGGEAFRTTEAFPGTGPEIHRIAVVLADASLPGSPNSTDAMLSPLGYWGGTTPTRPLTVGSLAADYGDFSHATDFDQRGLARDGRPDCGSCEGYSIGLPLARTLAVEIIGGQVVASGEAIDYGMPLLGCGFCWSLEPGPTVDDGIIDLGTEGGAMLALLPELTADSTWYVRAWATNEWGTAYGDEIAVEVPAASSKSNGGCAPSAGGPGCAAAALLAALMALSGLRAYRMRRA